MAELITPIELENLPLILHFYPVIQLTNDQFFEFCQLNQNLRIERTARGELLIMPPTGWGTGGRNFRLTSQLFIWTEQDKTGIGFDSSTGFILPNGATVSPDAAWIKLERWNAFSTEQQEKFAAIVVYASIFACVLASLPAAQTRMVVFDTAVVDLTDEAQDPIDLLFGTQLGGGTGVSRDLTYCQGV